EGLGDGDGLGDGEVEGDGLVVDGDGLDGDGLDGDGLGDDGLGLGEWDGEGDGDGAGDGLAGGSAGTTRGAPKTADHHTVAIFTFWPVVGASTILLSPRYMPTWEIVVQSVRLWVLKNSRSPGSSSLVGIGVVAWYWSAATRGSP